MLNEPPHYFTLCAYFSLSLSLVNLVNVLYSEELGQESQAVLLTYLKVVLTEWEEPYNERAELLMGRVSNKKNILELFSQLLISKVHRMQCLSSPRSSNLLSSSFFYHSLFLPLTSTSSSYSVSLFLPLTSPSSFHSLLPPTHSYSHSSLFLLYFFPLLFLPLPPHLLPILSTPYLLFISPLMCCDVALV